MTVEDQKEFVADSSLFGEHVVQADLDLVGELAQTLQLPSVHAGEQWYPPEVLELLVGCHSVSVLATTAVLGRMAVNCPCIEAMANELTYRSRMQSFNDRDRPSMRALLADDVTYGGLDAEKFLDVEFAWCELFPDLQIRIDDMIAEDDRVAFRWTFIGTHTARATSGGPLTPVGHADAISGLLTEVEPSGTSVEIPGIAVGKLKGGKIVEWWGE